MSVMFSNCSRLGYLDLSNFKADKTYYVNEMFSGMNKKCLLVCGDEDIKNQFKKNNEN